MSRKGFAWIISMVTVLILLGISGCMVAAVEATNSVYNHVRGDLLGIIPYQVEQVLPAAVTVIQELGGYDLADQESDFLEASITAYDQRSRKVQIDLSRTGSNQTEIQIRIGMMGDKLDSTMIFNRIMNQLSKQNMQTPASLDRVKRTSAL